MQSWNKLILENAQKEAHHLPALPLNSGKKLPEIPLEKLEKQKIKRQSSGLAKEFFSFFTLSNHGIPVTHRAQIVDIEEHSVCKFQYSRSYCFAFSLERFKAYSFVLFRSWNTIIDLGFKHHMLKLSSKDVNISQMLLVSLSSFWKISDSTYCFLFLSIIVTVITHNLFLF